MKDFLKGFEKKGEVTDPVISLFYVKPEVRKKNEPNRTPREAGRGYEIYGRGETAGLVTRGY